MSDYLPGKVYFGPENERQVVVGVDGDIVTLRHPTTFRISTRTLEEMGAFVAESDRRTYRRAGEQRTLIERRPAIRSGKGKRGAEVVYLDGGGERVTVPLKDWKLWREGAE